MTLAKHDIKTTPEMLRHIFAQENFAAKKKAQLIYRLGHSLLVAIRRASSFVSNLAADRRPGSSS